MDWISKMIDRGSSLWAAPTLAGAIFRLLAVVWGPPWVVCVILFAVVVVIAACFFYPWVWIRYGTIDLDEVDRIKEKLATPI